uniref:Uncharacterized protein n=1 Tax=Gossypium raimondii TaxID=29730 RepID=A0A0D2SSJ9_GOSRA|nr:hypothetical protein B456_010G155700 [Gossypium raimondii]
MKQDFALTEGDVITEVVEGVPLITFFDRVQDFIERRMSRTVIVKMLGGRIGFNASLNKISLLWSPRCPIQLMDLKNDFFLVRGMYYSNYLFRVIGQTVGLVVKLDVHTDCARRGYLARLAVCIDLRKSLVSKVKINDSLQRVEYESLPNICFKCGHYGHGVDLCTGVKSTNFEKIGSGVGYARGRVSTLVTPKIGTELIV